MTSLRVRLFAILLLATGLIWLSAVAWIYLGSKREVEQVLDNRLQEAARMVGSLVGAVGGTAPTAYERQLSCQIRSLDERMVARSSGVPQRRLSDAPAGFSEREVDGVGALVAETVDGMRGPPRVRTLIDPGLRGYTLRADPESLRLAVRNLHENAVQHMEAGTVEWTVRTGGEGVLVRDEGPGIPADELPHVTTRFFRGRHKSATGSGLGLAIAEMASRRSGLSLRLRNRPDGPGLDAEILRA